MTTGLIPPLIAFVALGLQRSACNPDAQAHRLATRSGSADGLACARRHYQRLYGVTYYHDQDLRELKAATTGQWMTHIAADVERVTTPDQWIITDAQFVSALANRDTPPWLLDPPVDLGVEWVSHQPRPAAGRSRSAGSCDRLCYRPFYPCASFQFPSFGHRNTFSCCVRTTPASNCGLDKRSSQRPYCTG